MKVIILSDGGFKEIDVIKKSAESRKTRFHFSLRRHLPLIHELHYCAVSEFETTFPNLHSPGVIITRTEEIIQKIEIFSDEGELTRKLLLAKNKEYLISILWVDDEVLRGEVFSLYKRDRLAMPRYLSHNKGLGFETYADSHAHMDPQFLLQEFVHFMPLFASEEDRKKKPRLRFSPELCSNTDYRSGIYVIRFFNSEMKRHEIYVGISCRQLYKTTVIHFQSEGENPTLMGDEIWYRNGHIRFPQAFVDKYTEWEVAYIVIPTARKKVWEIRRDFLRYEAGVINALSQLWHVHNTSLYLERSLTHHLTEKSNESALEWIKRAVWVFEQLTSDFNLNNLNGAGEVFLQTALQTGKAILAKYPLFLTGEQQELLLERIAKLELLNTNQKKKGEPTKKKR